MNDIDKALAFDALAEAERITGRSYKEDKYTSSLGLLMHVHSSESKRDLLKAEKDTHFGISAKDFYKIISDLGFKEIHSHNFAEKETYKVFYHPKHFCLLTSETFLGTSINSTKLYFEARAVGMNFEMDSFMGCSYGFDKDEKDPNYSICQGSYDAREGLVNKFNLLKDLFVDWQKLPFLWICDYESEKEEGFDYEKTTNKIIKTLPEGVRAKMSFK